MNFNFTPTETKGGINVPFIEDARADFAPYYTVSSHGKSVEDAKSSVLTEMAKLGASAVLFTEGFFGDKPRRYGYLIQFQQGNVLGRIEVAGLPIKTETEAKIKQSRVQALLNVRDWLKAAVTAQVFAPGSYPLMQYLLLDGERTLAESVIAERGLPNLNPALPSGR